MNLNRCLRKYVERYTAALAACSTILIFPAFSAHAQQIEMPTLEQVDPMQGGKSLPGAPVCAIFSANELLAEVTGDMQDGSWTGKRSDPATVYANCGERGIVLGQADSFTVATHDKSGAVAVLMNRAGRQRVWLLSLTDDGAILLEDLSGELSRSAGRGTMSGLADTIVDLASFKRAGTMQVRPVTRANAKPAQASQISLDARLQRQARALPSTDIQGLGE